MGLEPTQPQALTCLRLIRLRSTLPATDYAKRLAAGIAEGGEVLEQSTSVLRGCGVSWGRCDRLNESVCALTQSGAPTTELTIWNILGHPRDELITLPVQSAHVTVSAAGGKPVPVQVYAAPETVTNYARATAEATHVASFVAQLPAAGFATFELSQGSAVATAAGASAATSAATVGAAGGKSVQLENDHLALSFGDNGLLASITNKESGMTIQAAQSFCYYEGNVRRCGSNSRSSYETPSAHSCA